MGRIQSPIRIREGRGCGELLAEYAVILMIAGCIAAAVRWYLVVYLRSPSEAIQTFTGALNTANTDRQYDLLASSTRQHISREDYARRKTSVALSARIASSVIVRVVEQGDRAMAQVKVSVRQTGGPLYEAKTDQFVDDYALLREQGKWKVVLEQSALRSFQAVQR